MPDSPSEITSRSHTMDCIYKVLPFVQLLYKPTVETEGVEAIFPREANLDQ